MGAEAAQLERLEGFTARRRANHARLSAALAPLADLLVLPRATPGSRPSWFGFLLTLRDEAKAAGVARDAIVRRLEADLIQTRMLFAGNVVRQPCFDGRRALGSGYRVASAPVMALGPSTQSVKAMAPPPRTIRAASEIRRGLSTT